MTGDSGGADLWRYRGRQASRPALANQEQSNALQQFTGSVLTLRQKNVSSHVAFVEFHLAGEQDGRSLRRHVLNFVDERMPVHPWHDEVRQNQIHSPAPELLEGLFTVAACNHAI